MDGGRTLAMGGKGSVGDLLGEEVAVDAAGITDVEEVLFGF